MRYLLTITLMLFTWMGTAHAQEVTTVMGKQEVKMEKPNTKVSGQIWASYGDANHAVNRALLGVSHRLDEKWEGYLSLDVSETAGNDNLYKAYVEGSSLLYDQDHLKVGRMDTAYKGSMESWLGTRWLKPMYAQVAGLVNDRDDGIEYGGDYGYVRYAIQMMEKVEGDSYDAYSLLLSYEACDYATLLLSGEKYMDDMVYLAGLQLNYMGVKAALEYGKEAPDEGDGTSSYSATVAYSHSSGAGVYVNYITGDEKFKADRAYESQSALGLTYQASDAVQVGVLHQVQAYEGDKDSDDMTKALIRVEI